MASGSGGNRYKGCVERVWRADDDFSDKPEIWRELYPTWFEITPQRAREPVEAEQKKGVTNYSIRWRRRPGYEVTTADRATFNATVFDFQSVTYLHDSNMIEAQATTTNQTLQPN